LLDAPERFMAENKPALPRRRPTILTRDDFTIGSAYTECERANQDRTV
jgi:hypothetical protein